jgi:DNA polymerase-3 subunit delta'
MFLLRRGANDRDTGLSADIRVDEVRRMKSFFALSAADGGARVALIDSADELNTQAANALLKLLEEPPPGATFLVLAHQPHRLLPTIRSRCRTLRLRPLAPPDLAAALAQAGAAPAPDEAVPLAELAGGSVGEAFRLSRLDGLALYADLVALVAGSPRMERTRALTLAESAVGKGADDRFDLIVTLIDLFLARLARAGATRALPPEAAPGEAALLARLAPDPAAALGWADLAQTLGVRARRGRAVNLDPAALLMDSFLRIDETAGQLARSLT